jgi:hypothetical protein
MLGVEDADKFIVEVILSKDVDGTDECIMLTCPSSDVIWCRGDKQKHCYTW